MSVSANHRRAVLWLDTAHDDLRIAETLQQNGHHAAACFHSQQCAEKAAKALWYASDAEPWGHAVSWLLNEFAHRNQLRYFAECNLCAGMLDQFYIPTRYPDSLPNVMPSDVYHQPDSDRALHCARQILDACRQWVSEHFAHA